MSASAGRGRRLLFITHAEVTIDPAVAVDRWGLSEAGRARHAAFNAHPAVQDVHAVWSSSERKAAEGAAILAASRGVAARAAPGLHENDRSATGYLPPDEFERTADAFFASPAVSVRGWERALDAQRRVAAAVDGILAEDAADGDIAVVAHGGVGALLLALLLGEPITRRWDQPGRGGGNFFVVAVETHRVVEGWARIG